jgi:hypothetical protein
MPASRSHRFRKYSAAPVLVGLLLLSACSSGSTDTPTADAAATGDAAPGAAAGRMPGVNGLVAAVSGSTAQVQSTSTQTALTWTGTTTFKSTGSAALSDIMVGSCVVVRSATAGTDASSSIDVAATSIAVNAPVDGKCTAGGAGGRAGGGTPPSGAARPSGAPGGGGLGRGVFGTVTAVNGGTLVVQPSEMGAPGATTTSTSSTKNVTTSAATTYTKSVSAAADAVKVGVCVSAQGEAGTAGAVTATAITVRPAVDGTCTVTGGGPGA